MEAENSLSNAINAVGATEPKKLLMIACQVGKKLVRESFATNADTRNGAGEHCFGCQPKL